MGYFKDADEVYATLGKLFVEITADPELGPKFRQADTVVRYEYSDPESAITVRLQEGEGDDVEFGDPAREPEVTMTMEADTAHKFWLGEVNVTVALARGADQGARARSRRSSGSCRSRSRCSRATRRSSRRRAEAT